MLSIEYITTKIITPTLHELGLSTGKNLLLGTFAHESRLGTYLVQIGGGPALGLGQVEPPTNNLVLSWLMAHKPDMYQAVKRIRGRTHINTGIVSTDINLVALEHNHQYNCAIARCLYYSIQSPLPDEDDVEGMAHYWKKYYNTEKGKGTVEGFVESYDELVAPYL
jgi:hypothetical protein